MSALLLRLLLALTFPPLVGGTILFLVELGRQPRGSSEVMIGGFQPLVLFWVAGFVFCSVPGLVYWGGLEIYWRRQGPVPKPRFAAAGLLLGTICGVAVAVMLGFVRPGSVAMALIVVITGALVGLLTALAIFWTRRPRGSSGAKV